MCVSEVVKNEFYNRKNKILELILEYKIQYDEIGVFGSVARDSYKATSDLDICIITDHKPERKISGSLREDAEILRTDIVFVTRDYFQNSLEPFAIELRKDYRRIL